MSSDMLLVVPTDWTEYPPESYIGYDPTDIQRMIADQRWDEIGAMLTQNGFGLDDTVQTMDDAKMFNDGSGYRFWIHIIPV